MNKLFTKIAAFALGSSMAIGVGVAVAGNSDGVRRADAATTASVTISEYATANSWTSGSKYTSVTIDSHVTASCPSGKTYTGTYNNGWRLYATDSGSITVSTDSGTMSSITFTYTVNNSGCLHTSKASSVTAAYKSGTAISVSSASFTAYVANTNNKSNGQVYITAISVTYTPAVSYTISFNANGGTGTVPSNITGTGSKTLPSSASLTKTGYTLDGWGDSSHKDNASAQYALGAAYTLGADITLYAHWTANKYSVSASITNGGFTGTTGANAATYGTAYNATITANSGYLLPTTLTVTMGGDATNAYTYNSGTGAFSIAAPTGNISISATCPSSSATEYVFDYDLTHCSITSAPESMWSDDIVELTIVPDTHYKLPAEDANKVSVTGAVDWYYDEDDGTITIDGAEDDLTVTVECVAKAQNTISMGTLTGVSQASGNPTSVEEGATVTLTFVANEGYGLPTSSGVTVTGTGASSTWTQNTGKLQITGGTGNITVSITGIVRTVTSISLSSTSGSFELGDTFVMPTVTANYNVGNSEVVTAEATASGDGLVNDILTKAGTKTITISYGGQSATYTATVTAITPTTEKFVKVTSGTVASGKYLIVNEAANAAFNGGINSTSYDTTSNIVSVSISSSEIAYSAAMDAASFTYDASAGTLRSAAGYYIYRNGTSSGVTAQTSVPSLTTSITVSSGNAVISNQKDSSTMRLRYNNSSGQDRFRYYSSDSVQSIQIYKYQAGVSKQLKWITAEVKSGTYYQGNSVTASDFTVTAHYNDGTTSTPTSDITVTNGTLTVVGSNTVTLTYGGKSCNVNVTAVEQTATLTGLTWAQGEYIIIDGQNIDFSKLGTVTATYDVGGSATKDIGACTVSTYTKNNDTYTKVADLDDGDAITSSSHGKYLGVTYTEKAVTKVAYSSAPIYVVEAIEDVYTQVPSYTWSKVTSINDGDVVTFVEETDSLVASSEGDKIINAASYSGTVSTSFYFTVGEVKVGNNTYYTFHNEDGYLGNHSTGTSGNNYAYLDEEIDEENNKNYFTVSFNEGDVVITSVYDSNRKLQLRSGDTKDRFCFYGSAQLAIQLYKGTATYVPSGESMANTNAAVQKAVLEFAEHFNDTMNCVNGGSTANVASKWSTLASDFATALAEFSDDNLAHFKALFANAYSVEDGDSLQDMLARYDYIIAKYDLDDFLHDDAGRHAVAQSVHINPLNILNVNSNAASLLVVIAMLGLTVYGGYFFLRKRKED